VGARIDVYSARASSVNSTMRLAMRKMVFLLAMASACLGAPPLARHVVVIGLDGCRPELVRDHSRGALATLWREGAYTWDAEAAVPSVTQVNFASILTSCLPDKHGINAVAWNHETSPKLRVKVATIFEVLAAQRMSGAAFLGHEKLFPVEKVAAGIDYIHSPHGVKAAAPLAARHLRENQPRFTFIYFGDFDGAGHTYGWMSEEQIATLPEIERGVELVLTAIRGTAMKDDTVVIVTSDHGGLGKSHSTGRPEDRIIPWICWGAPVKRGPLSGGGRRVRNLDTAATALHVLGVAAPAEWDGRAVTEAFDR
jgi:predicted AlkP superfamily pyrophosphatase or phosphodiesterase